MVCSPHMPYMHTTVEQAIFGYLRKIEDCCKFLKFKNYSSFMFM